MAKDKLNEMQIVSHTYYLDTESNAPKTTHQIKPKINSNLDKAIVIKNMTKKSIIKKGMNKDLNIHNNKSTLTMEANNSINL
jgi:hypothetical protein